MDEARIRKAETLENADLGQYQGWMDKPYVSTYMFTIGARNAGPMQSRFVNMCLDMLRSLSNLNWYDVACKTLGQAPIFNAKDSWRKF